MTECVAQAIFEADWPNDKWERFTKYPNGAVKLRYTKLARAAIEVMREPTEAMLEIDEGEDAALGSVKRGTDG